MKKSKLNEVQIVNMLNEHKTGVSIQDLCRKYQISDATFYKIKSKYADMSVSDLKKLKALEDENYKLKQMYADISLEHKILKEVLEKKYPELIGKN